MAKIPIDLTKGTLKTVEKPPENVIIGIDLGTTNSLVAYMLDGKPTVVADSKGKNTLVPSIIHFEQADRVVVGQDALEKLVTDPQNTIFSIKRLMGKSYQDVADYKNFFSYQIIDNEVEDSLVKIRIKDKFYTPIELSAKILEQLKQRIENTLEAAVSKAVITVPAYFNDAQRQATRDAGKLAGLDVLRIVNEPTAASLAYGIGLSSEDTKTVAVYDLGGGTFDISILKIEHGIFEVLATNGDTFLGGDDFDRTIQQYWIAAQGFDLANNASLSQELRLAAEAAKKSFVTETVFETTINGKVCKIDKTTYEGLAKPLVERTLTACKNALEDAELSIADIEEVLSRALVGLPGQIW